MTGDLLSSLFPHPVVAACLAVLGALAGGFALTGYSARRTLTRPVAFALADETTVLAGVLTDLRRYPYVATIRPEDFAATSHHHIWTALRDILGPDADLPEDADEADAELVSVALADRHDDLIAALVDRLNASVATETDSARLATLLLTGRDRGYHRDADSGDAGDAAIITAAEAVLTAGQDRNRFAGAGLIVPGADPNSLEEDNPPLVRAHTPPSPLRRAATAAATGAVAGLLPGMTAATGLTGAAGWLAAASLVLLLATSVVLSLVDIDTLYIDTPVWAVGTVGCWALTVAAAYAHGDPGRLLAGIASVVAVVVLFEGTNLAFKLLRGVDGQGFGDTLIVVATVGIPPALTGDWRIGYVSMMAGVVAGAVGWTVARLAGRANRHTPFAFGPWLACGWVLAMVWLIHDALTLSVLS